MPKNPGRAVELRTVMSKRALLTAFWGLIALNLLTFLAAYPGISNLGSAQHLIAKDFSAYYVGGWRLFHDTARIYTRGFINDGEIHVYPVQEQFKYLPSFLLMFSPFLLFDYQQGIVLFDVFQLVLLPLIGLLLYLLVKDKGPTMTFLVAVAVLLLPSPDPGWGMSIAYFWQWKEGQAKVLETFLLLLSFALGTRNRPLLSGMTFGLSFFDPRFAIVAVPLFVMYNKLKIRSSGFALITTLVVSNFPLFYPGTAAGFLNMVFSTGIGTTFYPYAFIPLLAVVSLGILNHDKIVATFAELHGKYPRPAASVRKYLSLRPRSEDIRPALLYVRTVSLGLR